MRGTISRGRRLSNTDTRPAPLGLKTLVYGTVVLVVRSVRRPGHCVKNSKWEEKIQVPFYTFENH